MNRACASLSGVSYPDNRYHPYQQRGAVCLGLQCGETAAGAVTAKTILLGITASPFNNIGIQMSLKKNARLLFAFSFAALFVCMISDSESQAQARRRQAGAEIGRFLGFGYGNGYHCRTPGPNTDYYNPYSKHNSHLVSHYPQGSSFGNRYHTGGGIDQGYVPHAEYSGTGSDGYSVFQSVPGQTLTPTFEPAPERKSPFDEERESRDLDDELEMEAEEDRMEAESKANDFRSRLRDSQDSPLNDEPSGEDLFDTLRDNLDGSDAEPSDLDQALFFGN